ncbi:MAG: EAL domain-containing protein [Anaerovoracaceae bacterium]
MLFKLWRICETIENNKIIQSISAGLVFIIPVLMTGAVALVFKSMPVDVYQTFIKNFAGGLLVDLFDAVYEGTFGILSFYMAGAISFAIMYINGQKNNLSGTILTSMICFAVLNGIGETDKEAFIDAIGVKGMFAAIFTGVVFTHLYLFLQKIFLNRKRRFGEGVDSDFRVVISGILPCVVACALAEIIRLIFSKLFNVNNITGVFVSGLNDFFSNMGLSFFSTFCFVLISSLLWFVGIHGSDALQGVNETLFEPAIIDNVNSIAAGLPAPEIFSKTFIDVFVLIGGCGSSFCLLAALFLFSRRKSSRAIAKLAVFPMIFNISEPLIFGLPIVFNPIFLIPFILTPMVSLVTAYIATVTGFVPVCVASVEWTTPIFLGGYIATGSIRGSILQIVNLVIGTAIYRPFVKLYDEEKNNRDKLHLQQLINTVKENEEKNQTIVLTELPGPEGKIAQMIAADLQKAFDKKEIRLFYQPQHDNTGRCIGAEALMRWKHSTLGFIYPPLVIKLAEEIGILEELEKSIFNLAVEELEAKPGMLAESFKVSLNVSAKTIQMDSFVGFLENFAKHRKPKFRMCIEITEQAALSLDENITGNFEKLRKLGFLLAIDDFSMGSTSLKYLQESFFDIVKLDGGIVRAIGINERSRTIVESIVQLSKSLGFEVIAEFVENEGIRKALEESGCRCYQGYLYSPAIPLEELEKYLREN